MLPIMSDKRSIALSQEKPGILLYIALGLSMLCMLLISACRTSYRNHDNWYQASVVDKKHTFDAYHMLIDDLVRFHQVSYFGERIKVRISQGMLYDINDQDVAMQDTSLELDYQTCTDILIRPKTKIDIKPRTLLLCYRDDLLMIGPEHGGHMELLRIYRSPVWQRGFDYHPLTIALPVGIKGMHIHIQNIDRAHTAAQPKTVIDLNT